MKQPLTGEDWNRTAAALEGAHLLQSWEWGQFKKAYGWQPLPRVWSDEQGTPRAAALTLQRTLAPLGLNVLYVPRGPLVDWTDAGWRTRVLAELETIARRRRAIFIKIDPEVVVGTGVPGQETAQERESGQVVQADLRARGWKFSSEQIQFRNTVMIDLTEPEDAWLARLKQKARYNLRLGEKRAVQVRMGNTADLQMLYQMYAETSVRDGFLIRSVDYYLNLWTLFLNANRLDVFIAQVEGQPVAAIMVFYFAEKAWYLQGMSTALHREKMPNYLLQWHAMRRARARGCKSYDLWGAPDQFTEQDGLWGVYKFKDSLGGQTVRTIGAWDFPTNHAFYTFYMKVLPRLLDIWRRRGRNQTRQEVLG